ncbi:MAG TPA: Imm52 family immunity protein [Stellaceae bacterium]|nr:Imm52 family immunity protein [Stellaceae bacterium]
MRDLFSIKVGWGLREETVEACASRSVRMLNDLWDIHRDFRTLRWDGVGHVTVRNLHELCQRGDLVRILKRRRVHNTSRTRIVSDGYDMSANSGVGSSQSLHLRLHAGAGSEDADRIWLPNEIELTIIPGEEVDAVVSMLLALRPTLLAMVDAWDVDWGGLYSTSRIAQTITGAERFRWRFSGAWAVYLADRFAERVTPPRQAVVERRCTRGVLISAAKEVFDASNPAQVEAANAIDASLEPLKPWPEE